MKTCPECSETLSPKATRCACGWRSASFTAKPQTYRCEWVARERCHYAGSIAAGTRGDGPWFCTDHFFCHDALTGDEIVEISRKEFPNPDDGLNHATRRVLQQTRSAPIDPKHARAMLRDMREMVVNTNGPGMRIVGRDLEREVERAAIQGEGATT